ncbi:MAG: type II toxin-antitoxin system RelE/ParE family toxin [Anaerolineae bacterium]
MDEFARTWRIEFYSDSRERIPAYEFIQSLAPQDHAACLRALDLLAHYGPRLSMPHARHIEGKLWELRAGPGRLFYFLDVGQTFIVVHGYRKKSQRAPKREVQTAIRRMNELLGGSSNVR